VLVSVALVNVVFALFLTVLAVGALVLLEIGDFGVLLRLGWLLLLILGEERGCSGVSLEVDVLVLVVPLLVGV
jgi:hypothetical protein